MRDVVGGGFREIFGGWNLTSLLFAPEPQFSVHYSLNGPPIDSGGSPIEVSKSGNGVLLNVVAQLPTKAAQVTWGVAEKPDFVNTDIGSGGRTGSGTLRVFAAPGADVGDFGFILVDSFPTRGTDSLRNGPIQIPVKITK
jgi:hypothetical protein